MKKMIIKALLSQTVVKDDLKQQHTAKQLLGTRKLQGINAFSWNNPCTP
jgi:hypothetical protein